MPFARWTNNDLWNLLPTNSEINNQKSDRLPTEHKLKASKERIQHWWQQAWLSQNKTQIEVQNQNRTNLEIKELSAAYRVNAEPLIITEVEQSLDFRQGQSKRFFAEANIALPGLSSANTSIEDVFEALIMQLGRLKEMQ
ncbi:hypothetical protein [Psychrosphaera sp. 1_MG-2023]|uniref:hypothetical protein n=1 Tax=Psychrosphaera sp. 1_MG-2023 TaxID=3062643 RepID=UPI0034A13DB7